MTNEEKAKELARETTYFSAIGKYSYTLSDVERICLNMAQWKDEQFSKFLLWLDNNYVIKRFTDGEPMTYAELIDNFKSNSYE